MKSFEDFERLTAGDPDEERVTFFFEWLGPEDRAACWSALAQECAEHRERARRADPEEVEWHRRPRLGRRWETRSSAKQPARLCINPEDWLGREDGLRDIEPAIYFSVLTGIEMPPSGMVECPFHFDRTPSCHVWKEGWFCHGCHAGGDIFSLGAQLWNLDSRRDFLEVRRRLLEVFHVR